jgi:hypothetical protein
MEILTSIRIQKKLIIVVFFFLTLWSLYINFLTPEDSFDHYLFGAVYGIIALWGGLGGLLIAKKWGGWSSVMGKAIILLSCGLLAQEFGQLVFSYYNIYAHIEVPYPSLADVGFMGSIFFYAAGMIMLGKAAGISYSLKKVSGKLQVILIPLAMLIVSYSLFLTKYEFDWSSPLTIFLDFAYPLGPAIYISFAIFTYTLSNKFLGGIMKKKILFIIFAFVAQFVCDYNFLFQSSRGTWVNGGYGDYLYLVAYFLMAVGMFRLADILAEVKIRS